MDVNTVISIELPDGRFQCVPCQNEGKTKIVKSLHGFGQHFTYHCDAAEELIPDIEDRKELIRRKRYRRNNQQDSVRESKAKYQASDKGREATRKANRKYALTEKRKKSAQKHRRTLKGRLTKKLCQDRYYAKHPLKRAVQIAMLKSFSKVGHRIKKHRFVNYAFQQKFKRLINLKKSKKISNAVSSFLSTERLTTMRSTKGRIDLRKYDGIKKRVDEWFNDVDSRVSNYVYLLVDLRRWHEKMTFAEFLKLIFYVGRGVDLRFISHPMEAQTIRAKGRDPDPKKYPKEAKILKIWKNGHPIQVVSVDLNKFATKTDFTEFAINALLSPQLTNKQLDGMNATPAEFEFADVSETALLYLSVAYNNRETALDCYSDDDFGEKLKHGK